MSKQNTLSFPSDSSGTIQPGAISRRKENATIVFCRDLFEKNTGYLKSYQSPNQIVADYVGQRAATLLRRMTLATMRIVGDPEALAEKRVRIDQQSKKSS